ncbi:MAG: ribonuclease Z [Paraprevotella sp.]|nr:ribonuclease Z [Paraprevotella sp.]
MEKFELTILGCGSALPTTRHFATSQVINLRDKLYMIDCGEGAQLQLRRSHLKCSRLNRIFISHLHGDHCFGLIGLISTFNLLGRTATLHVHAPEKFGPQLRDQLDFFCKGMDFSVEFHPIDTTRHALIYEDRSLSVYSIPLRHRIECSGFLFKEKATRPHIRRDMIDFYRIPISEINNIKNGKDWMTEEGTLVPHSMLTTPSAPPRTYAYCSDTCYLPELAALVQDVDLLFHEATFLHQDLKRAQETFHTTALQAATLARDSHAKKLCIGHFSARYEDEQPLLEEACSVFPQTILAKENLLIPI